MRLGTMMVGLLTLVVLAGCKESQPQASPSTAPPAAAAVLPAGLMLSAAPDAPLDVIAAKEKAAVGDAVVVRGRIGGRVEPFVEGRAIFQLVDTSVPTCKEKHSDGCPTPWDYCCEPKDQVTAKSVTVQIAGPDGKPLAMSLKGQAGLDPMAQVVIRGKVESKPNDTAMTIRAEGIYVEPS